MILQKSIDKIGGSDDGLHDFTALFVYFCNSFNQTIDEEDSNWQSSMITIGSKEQYNLSSYDKVQEEIIEESGQMAKDVQKIFAQMLPKAVPGKSFAEMWDLPPGRKEYNLYQMLWDLGQLDGYNLSMFENGKVQQQRAAGHHGCHYGSHRHDADHNGRPDIVLHYGGPPKEHIPWL